MDNYISELASICKLPFEDVSKSFKLIWFGNSCLYISNYKKIIDYSSSRVVLKINNNTLEISGLEIVISQINKGEIIISGQISSVALGVMNDKKK